MTGPSHHAQPRSDSRQMVLVFTDLAGSVDMKSRLGNAEYLRLLERHDEIFKAIRRATRGTLPGSSAFGASGPRTTRLRRAFWAMWIVLTTVVTRRPPIGGGTRPRYPSSGT